MATQVAHVSADSLKRAVALASSAVLARSPHEAYKFVRCEFTPGGGLVQAYNGQWSVTAAVGGVECDGTIVLAIPCDKLAAVAAGGGNDTVRFEKTDKDLTAAVGRSRYTLPTMNPSDWPNVPDGSHLPVACEIEADELRRAIDRTSFATEEASTRYALGGVCFDLSEERVAAVATDSKRLSVVPMSLNRVEEWVGTQAVVPVGPLKLAAKLTGTVEVRVSDRAVAFTTPDVAIVSQLVEGRFPKYRQVIPQGGDEVVLAANPFADLLRQAIRFMPPEKASVTVEIDGGDLTVRTGGDGVGGCELSIPVAFDGRFICEVAPAFLIDFLSRVGDESATLRFTNDESALVFMAGEWTYVAMPIVRGTEETK